MMKVLFDFGFGGAGIPQEAIETEGHVIHLGVEPNRIDLLTSVKGVSNKALFRRVKETERTVSRYELFLSKTF